MTTYGYLGPGRGAQMDLRLREHVEHATGHRLDGYDIASAHRHDVLNTLESVPSLVEAGVGGHYQVVEILELRLDLGLLGRGELAVLQEGSPEGSFGVEVPGCIAERTEKE